MRHSPLLTLAIFLVGLVTLVAPAEAQEPMGGVVPEELGTIQGVLRDAATGREVADAKVELSALAGGPVGATVTNTNGQFLLDGIPRGAYTISVQHPDYLPFSQQVTTDGHPTFGLQLSVRKKPVATTAADAAAAPSAGATSAVESAGRATGIPKAAQDAMNRGMDLLYVKSDARGSLDQFERATREYPGFYEAYTQMGLARTNLGDSADAEKAFRKAIELSQEKYSDAYAGLAVVLSDTKRYKDAEAAARKTVELNPNDWRGHGELARALHGQQQYQDAEEHAVLAAKLAPSNPTLLLLLSSIHLQLKDLPAMLEDLDAYLKLVPTGPDADRMRELRGKVQQAIAAAQPAQPK